MQILWCWRCKENLPMLDESEFHSIWQGFDPKRFESRQLVLDAFERLTGCRLPHINVVHHHRSAIYGPPCPRCGKVLRTPIAYKCFECGLVVHEPNWAVLFDVSDTVDIKGQRALITEHPRIEGKLRVGDLVEVWDIDRRIGHSRLKEIHELHDRVALLFSPDLPWSRIARGQRVQLAQDHCTRGDMP